MAMISLYVHIPFCIHRCGYCDFNTYAGLSYLLPVYTKAVCAEIEFLSHSAQEQIEIHTVYFGGGTPSLLFVADFDKILNQIRKHFNVLSSAEISLEANPGTISRAYLLDLHSMGVNRISLGMQSAEQTELELLERQHSFEDVEKAVEWSYAAGINNLNLDLIFGLPDQSIHSWTRSLETALTLKPEHLSLYALTLEHGTPMQLKVETGALSELDADLAADMYEAASDRLETAGYCHYEISNWARIDQDRQTYVCKHNLQYWKNLPYIGVGAGAHGYINGFRTVDVPTPGAYIQRMNNFQGFTSEGIFPRTPATSELNPIDTETEIGETMMMGLRLVAEGVSNADFTRRFGTSLEARFGKQIRRLIGLGLLEWAGNQNDRLRLTKRGHLLGNQVFTEFI